MIWSRLKNNKCPDCNEELTERDRNVIKCSVCDFRIGMEKYEKLIADLYRKKIYTVRDNLSDLNNL